LVQHQRQQGLQQRQVLLLVGHQTGSIQPPSCNTPCHTANQLQQQRQILLLLLLVMLLLLLRLLVLL
jgi:hypothetical protein